MAGVVERPILFQDRLVQALLAGRKTQTRRVGPAANRWLKAQTGDVLWVREAWAPTAAAMDPPPEHRYQYRATQPAGHSAMDAWAEGGRWRPSIHMPRTACRLRLELTEAPRLERLQDLTEADAAAEGPARIEAPGCAPTWGGPVRHEGYTTARGAFLALWDSINAPRGYGWDTNPMVAALRFRVLP